jgi:hypothetical protein
MRLTLVASKLVVLLVPALAFAACGVKPSPYASDDEDEDEDDWICNEQRDGSACECDLPRRSGSVLVGGADQVDVCRQFTCCLLSEEGTDFAKETCECLQTQDCQAEAASRPGTSVIPACPPNSDPTLRCAAPDENCRDDYLGEHDLTGCCAGTVCRENAAGIPVCLFPSPEEAACLEFAAGSELAALEVTESTFETSLGSFELDAVVAASLDTGSEGCLKRVQMSFAEEGAEGCALGLTAAIAGNVIVNTSARGSVSGCDGFSGEATEGTLADDAYASAFTFTGTWCERAGNVPAYCYSGTFEWLVTAPTGPVTFENQRLVAEGFLCSSGNSGTCSDR